MGFKDKLPSEISIVNSSICQYICPNVWDISQFYPDLIMFITSCDIKFDNFYQTCVEHQYKVLGWAFCCIKKRFQKHRTNHWTRTASVAPQDAAKDAKDRATSDPFAIFLKVRVPLIGGRWYIIPQLAVYTTYIYLYTPFCGVICYLYHLLRLTLPKTNSNFAPWK